MTNLTEEFPDVGFESEPIDTWLSAFVTKDDAKVFDRVRRFNFGGAFEIEDLEALRAFRYLRRFDFYNPKRTSDEHLRFQADMIEFYASMPTLRTHTTQRIQGKLDGPSACQFKDIPLVHVVMFFEDTVGDIDIAFDSSTVEDSETRITTARMLDKPFGDILSATLEPVGLEYEIRAPYLLIVSKE